MRKQRAAGVRYPAACGLHRSAVNAIGHLPYPVAIIGTGAAIMLAWAIHLIGGKFIDRSVKDPKEHYRRQSFLTTALVVAAVIVIVVLWARPMQRTGTFLGLLGAGVAVALRDPLLSIAGRIAIFSGNIYSVGDRIEINSMIGDVIDVGFFYTQMMEIGNWITADQMTGRLVQFSNSNVFGNPVFNYTRNFSYIWDEVRLPITYASDVGQARRILLEAGGQYTKEFLEGARNELEQMRRHVLLPEVELAPAVYMKVTSNWVELTMRYVVEAKLRRRASTFIYSCVFDSLQKNANVTIASETMDLTVHPPDSHQEAAVSGNVQGESGAGSELRKRVVSESKEQHPEDRTLPGDKPEAA